MLEYWATAFVLIWLVEFVLFGMQRASLLISRKAGYLWKGGGQYLLPRWYRITWIVIGGKWVLLIAMAIVLDWKLALGLAVCSYLLSLMLPIPYGAYKGIFRKRVSEIRRVDPDLANTLQQWVNNAPF